MDAGFLREEDYIQARDAFLHSLDFRVTSSAPVCAHQQPQHHNAQHHNAGFSVLNSPKVSTQQTSAPRNQQQSILSYQSQPQQQQQAPARAPAAPLSLSRQGSGSVGGAGPLSAKPAAAPVQIGQLVPGAVPVPTDLPNIGRMGAWTGKRSMSGISLNDNSINLYNYIKSRSSVSS